MYLEFCQSRPHGKVGSLDRSKNELAWTEMVLYRQDLQARPLELHYSNRLVTPHATNQDMLPSRKSSLWGCYQLGHVTNRVMLLLATLWYYNCNRKFRYLEFCQSRPHCKVGSLDRSKNELAWTEMVLYRQDLQAKSLGVLLTGTCH